MQPSRSLLAFAVMADSFIATGDIVQGLMLLFEPIANDLCGERFDPKRFATELKTRYDLELPLVVAEDWAKRLETAGYLENVSTVQSLMDYKYKSQEPQNNDLSIQQFETVLNEFKAFVQENLAGISFSEHIDLSQEFNKRLVRIENLVSLHEIRPDKVGNSAQPISSKLTLQKTKEKSPEPSPRDDHIAQQLDFLFARFVESLASRNDGSLDLLSRISGGAMLAEVVLSFQEPPKSGESLDDVDFYLDAPLIMDLLGLDKQRGQYAQELYKTLKSVNARLWIFDHGLDEIDRAIHARTSDAPNGWQRPTTTQEKLLLTKLRGRIPQELASLGIQIMRFQGDAFERSLAHFSQEQEDRLFSALTFHSNETARTADARSLANIVRLRRNRRIQSGAPLLHAGPVLVTRNSALANIARRMMRNATEVSNGSLSHSQVDADICIMDSYLAGLLWITVGGTAKQLPYAQLVANCASAVSPKRGIVAKAIKLLSGLDHEDAVALEAIMQDERAEHYLMDLTLRDVTLVTNENIREIYEKIRQSVGKETEDRLKAEFARKLDEREKQHAVAIERILANQDESTESIRNEIRRMQDDLLATSTQVLQQSEMGKKQQEENEALKTSLELEQKQKIALLQDSLGLTKKVGKVVPMLLGLFLAIVLWKSQNLLTSLGDGWKSIVEFGTVSLSVFSFIIAFWDNPQFFFGPLRKMFHRKCYTAIVNFRGLETTASSVKVDWHNMRIMPTAEAIGAQRPAEETLAVTKQETD